MRDFRILLGNFQFKKLSVLVRLNSFVYRNTFRPIDDKASSSSEKVEVDKNTFISFIRFTIEDRNICKASHNYSIYIC